MSVCQSCHTVLSRALAFCCLRSLLYPPLHYILITYLNLIYYFNEWKQQVPLIPWVSCNTTPATHKYYTCAIMGTVWPMLYLITDKRIGASATSYHIHFTVHEQSPWGNFQGQRFNPGAPFCKFDWSISMHTQLALEEAQMQSKAWLCSMARHDMVRNWLWTYGITS